ncbi:unnamed protein product [Nesidiocoris tenuis]|uniref:Liprin-alpha CC2 domain-containing protein n=1 Tax=Nesidiocoris tenuis TaxID=355587 RepID=A0A6H5H9B6_9HEMI|nr:unnamed protein product [Nesidiocoris tenuis]
MERQHERCRPSAGHLLRRYPHRGAPTGGQPLQKWHQTTLHLCASSWPPAGLISQNPKLLREFATLTKELNQSREHLLEREEEIQELKAERNNTRLLLEHLECLVSRHERSLRMTVVKRQAAAQSVVSSEVEVLKALKSLFEHHKALDEKLVTNGSIEQENEKPKSPDVPNDNEKQIFLKFLISWLIIEQNAEIRQWERKVGELTGRVAELEDSISKAQREISRQQDTNSKLQRDLRENVAQKEDQLQEDKIRALQEKLELCEQKLAQYAKLPEMEEELRARMQALSQVRDQVGDTRLGPALRTPLHKLTAKGAMNCRYIEILNSAEN